MNYKKVLFLCAFMIIPLISKGITFDRKVTINGLTYNLFYWDTVGQTPMYAVLIKSENSSGYEGDVIIPEYIEDYLQGKNGEYLAQFPVKSIAVDAFKGCSNLTSIYISSTVNYIASIYPYTDQNLQLQLSDCIKLASIEVSSDNIVFDSRDGCNALLNTSENTVIAGCKSSFIPYGIIKIGPNAFKNCIGLTAIEIPSSVKSIEDYAFSGCTGLISIMIPETINYVSWGAFSGCTNVTSITLGANVTDYIQAFNGCSSLKDVYSPGDFAPLMHDSFLQNEVKDATLHVNGHIIGKYDKEPWIWFKTIVPIEGTEEKFKLSYYIDDEIYDSVYYNYGDTIVPIEHPVKKGMTFSGWIDIPKVMPGRDVVVYGTFSWYQVTKSNVIYQVADTIKNHAYVIGNENANGEIKILSQIDFDNDYNVTDICDKVFYGCKDITKLEIPATVATIGERAFANIDKLTDVTCWAEEVPTTDRTVFENSYIEDYVTLHVPYGSLEKYKETAPWKNFKNIVVIEGTQRTFTLTYKVDGEVYKTYDIKEGEPITPEAAPTKEGYTFSGWSEIPEIMPSNDLTITGTFTINKYKLVYMVDNEEYKSYEIEYNAVITPEAVPTKEGYTFSGWSEIPEKMPDHDVTVTGTFAVNKYQLIYKVDGEVYKTYEMEYGAAITPEADPTKEGWTFSGWSWIPKKMPAEDVTITGTFTQNQYEAEGGTYVIDEDGATIVKGEDKEGEVVIETTITINGNTYHVTVIGEAAFKGCTKMSALVIPDGIKTIGTSAFEGCSHLRNISIGKGVTAIDHKAFSNIGTASAASTRNAGEDGLKVSCTAEAVPTADSDVFENTYVTNATLVVNDDLVNSYKTTSPWSQFGNIVGFNEASGIGLILSDQQGAVIYSIDGLRLDSAKKGLNVIRTEQGEVKKIVVR